MNGDIKEQTFSFNLVQAITLLRFAIFCQIFEKIRLKQY